VVLKAGTGVGGLTAQYWNNKKIKINIKKVYSNRNS
jgi:hypothetical protein